MILEPFVTDSLWVVQIPLKTYGLEIGTRMTVCLLSSGYLWVHSPINPDEELRKQLDSLGIVKFIIAPNRQHHFFIRDFIAAYPDALLFGSTDLPQKFPDIPFDGVLGEQPEPGWSDDLDQVPIHGNIFHDEVVFFHRQSRTLIVTDLCISGHPEQPPFTRFVLWLGGVYQNPAPLLDVKLAYLDKKAARSSLKKVMDWDFERMILAHGHLINSGAKPIFERAYRFLLEG